MYRQPEYTGNGYREDVHQQKGPYVKDQKRDKEFVDLPNEESRKTVVRFEEKTRYEEIKRHAEAGQKGTGVEPVESASDVQYDDQNDTEPLCQVYKIDPSVILFFHVSFLRGQR